MEEGFGGIKAVCAIAGVVTKDFGVLASDSAHEIGEDVSFESPKLFYVGNKNLITYVGYKSYLSNVDFSKLNGDMASTSIYLSNYFRSIKDTVKSTLSDLTGKNIEPNLCVLLMGVHNGKPTLAQFNSYLDFKPKYLYSDNGPKFSTIFYSEDNPNKKKMFVDMTKFMEEMAEKKKDVSPGILAEILTRGIYKKSDLEEELEGKKYAGGAVSVAYMDSKGEAYPLSNVRF